MKQKGFTLIELMVVIAILGILISIAVPAYRDHIVRARVMEGLSLVSQAKTAVNEAAMINRALPDNQEATHYVSPSSTSNVASITIGSQGIITITYTSKAGDGTILFVPALNNNGEITWTCDKGTLLEKYRPSSCRVEKS